MKSTIIPTRRAKLVGVALCSLLGVCLVVFSGVAALGQNAKLQLSQLDKLARKASQVTNVNLDKTALQLAAQMVSEKGTGNGGVATMLRRLQGVYVKTFQFSKPGEYTNADLNSVMRQLQRGGWKPIVHVEQRHEESRETTGIYVMQEGGEVVGMAVIDAQPKRLVVVNLVGPINFSQLGGLGGLGALGKLGGLGGMVYSKPQLQRRPSPK